jgi:hypothetical protein
MKKRNNGVSAEGRIAPPAQSKFRKGRSGNRGGRPKGSISLNGITRKVALKLHSVPIEGKPRRVTLLELLILKTKAMAATGQPGAARQINWLRSQIELAETESSSGGFAIGPASVTPEEFVASLDAEYAGKCEPGTFVDVQAEEFLKTCRGERSTLGEALRAFYEKYGARTANR